MANPSSYTRHAGLAVARWVAEGVSLTRAASLLPPAQPQFTRWKKLPDPEFRKLLALARLAAAGDLEATTALYATPDARPELLDALLERMPDGEPGLEEWVAARLSAMR